MKTEKYCNIQAMLDGMRSGMQRERAATQMTLGDVIETLEELPPDTEIEGLKSLHSYRGYYNDLAFEREGGKRPACEILAICRTAMGKIFTVYKGGDYMMGEYTPMWIADYGCCGGKIIEIRKDGSIETALDC